MALGSTQPLTEMSTRNLPGVKGGRDVRLTSPPSVSRLSRENVGASTSHNLTMCHSAAGGMRSIENCIELTGNLKSERTNKPSHCRGKLSNGSVRESEKG
jgi:hypothetical protein